MNKKDFVHLSLLAHVLSNPEKRTPKQVIQWGADVWDMTNKMMGTSKPSPQTRTASSNKPKKPMGGWYKTLGAENETWLAFFIRFWKAFSAGEGKSKDTRGRDEAAGEWLHMCQSDKPSTAKFKHIAYAGSLYAKERPNLISQGLTPIMAVRYIKNRRFDDVEPYTKENARTTLDVMAKKRREILADIHHFETQYKNTQNHVWKEQLDYAKHKLEKLTEGRQHE